MAGQGLAICPGAGTGGRGRFASTRAPFGLGCLVKISSVLSLSFFLSKEGPATTPPPPHPLTFCKTLESRAVAGVAGLLFDVCGKHTQVSGYLLGLVALRLLQRQTELWRLAYPLARD